MIKLNNKGFAISTLLYSMIIIVMMIVLIMMSIMTTTRKSTKELAETIEQELTGHAKNEAEFTGDGTYAIPQAGWYKIEIWDDNDDKYYSAVRYFSTSDTVTFSFVSGSVTVSGFISSEREGEYLGTNKARIKFVSANDAVNSPTKYVAVNPISNGINGKYYISDNETGAIEVLTANADNSVSFQPISGEKNQEWVVEKVDVAGGGSYFKIINAATGLLLSPQEETGAIGTYLVAQTQNLSSEQAWTKWNINFNGLDKYELETQLTSAIVLAVDGTLQSAGTADSEFYFLYSDF